MKRTRIIGIIAVLAFLPLLFGCATAFPVGSLSTEVPLPMEAGDASGKATKVGTAECMSVLGLVATGDASIEAAKKNGNITKVHHVDWYAQNILGIIGKYKVMVYGE